MFQSPSQRGGGAAAFLHLDTDWYKSTFQSPSQRGGGAATADADLLAGRILQGFNPLRKGEAAPPACGIKVPSIKFTFQSPSQRGGGAAITPQKRPGSR